MSSSEEAVEAKTDLLETSPQNSEQQREGDYVTTHDEERRRDSHNAASDYSSPDGGGAESGDVELRIESPGAVSQPGSNGAAAAAAATSAAGAGDNKPRGPNGNLLDRHGVELTDEEMALYAVIDKEGADKFHQAFDHDKALGEKTKLVTMVLMGISVFCFVTSFLWTATFWVLKFTMEPSCWNPFDAIDNTSFAKFQETWNFCWLSFWPMSFVTFAPQFPQILGLAGCVGGFLQLKIVTILAGSFIFFGVTVQIVLIILAFVYGFPVIYPLIFAFYGLLSLAAGICLMINIPAIGLIEERIKLKSALRKRLTD